MKILIVAAQFPYPPRSGFATRVYQLARRLSHRHSVTLLSYAWPHERDGVAALSQEMSVRAVPRDQMAVQTKRAAQAASLMSLRPYYCREVFSRRMQEAIDEVCAGESFDIIQLESSFLCAFEFPAGPKLVLDEHNIESEVFRRMCESERSIPRRAFNRVEHARFRHWERRWWTRADGCVVSSDREVDAVRTAAPRTPLAVVPNGVDLEYFSPAGSPVQPRSLVFNGIMTYRPNLDAALYLLDEVWPHVRDACPDARLTIVGRGTQSALGGRRQAGVDLFDEVPDIRPHLQHAAVVAVPVRIGGGTRLKVVEGLAMGKAIVSTSLGCEGLAVRNDEHLVIADDPRAFAARCVELFGDPDRAEALGLAGRALMEREYSWDLIGDRLEALHRELLPAERAGDRSAEVRPSVTLRTSNA